MIKFFHRLFNPHCPHCIEEAREGKVCQSCETLIKQLELANHEKKQLLSMIQSITNPPKVEVREVPSVEPIPPRNIPWAVRKQTLEAEDRARAKLMREKAAEIKPEEIEELEKVVGIANGERTTN